MTRSLVDEIPVLWEGSRAAPIALWMPPLTGTKEQVIPMLERLAANGFLAISFDPWRHGERGRETPEEIRDRVFGRFRRQMWPTIGQTTLDCLRVIDWATDEFGAPAPVVAGGLSMGGDTAVALAGIEPRVARVAAVVATPDWTRPGMRDLADPTRELAQGEAGAYAQWFYDRLDPMTHLDAYAGGPAISFECGADDVHVPPEAAQRFAAALPAGVGQVRVNLHPGVGHLGPIDGLLDAALDWLTHSPLLAE